MVKFMKSVISILLICTMLVFLIACSKNQKIESESNNQHDLSKIIDFNIKTLTDAKIVNNELWFLLGWKKGIYKLNLETEEIKCYGNDSLIDDKGYYNTISHFQNNIWFFTENCSASGENYPQTILRYDISKNEFIKYFDGQSARNARTTVYAINDKAWIGTHNGLLKIDLTNNKIDVINNEYINDIAGNNDDIFIGTIDKGVIKINKGTKNIQEYNENNVLESNYTLGVELFENYLLVDSINENMEIIYSLLNIKDNCWHYFKETDCKNQNIESIYTDKNNIGFITTNQNNKMIFYQFNFNTEQWDTCETINKLNENYINDTLFLNKYVLMGLNNGLLIFNQSLKTYDKVLDDIEIKKILSIDESTVIVLSTEGIYKVNL